MAGNNLSAKSIWDQPNCSNTLIFSLVAANSKDGCEIYQSNKELQICQRKLDYWKKHPDFDINICHYHNNELIKKWSKK